MSLRKSLRKCCFLQAAPLLETRHFRSQTFAHKRTTNFAPTRLICTTIHRRSKVDAETHHRSYVTASLIEPEALVPVSVSEQQQEVDDDDDDADADADETYTETFCVDETEAGTRIDKLLAKRYNTKSRTYIQNLLSNSCVTCDSQVITTKSYRPTDRQTISVNFLPIERNLPLVPEAIPLDIVYEDEHLLIINKPAGMVVHPAPGNWTGTLVHAICHAYADVAALGGARPGIIHRIDKGTSGLLAVARTAETATALSSAFAKRAVRKQYVAITVGNPAGAGCASRTFDEPIGRSPTDRLRMAILPEEAGGRAAYTAVSVRAHDASGLLHAVRVDIVTGRTHQIRVHMRHARTPVLGDHVYGAHDVNKRFCTAAARPLLHAHRLVLQHPVTGTRLDFSARLPDDMAALMRRVVYPDFESEGW